MIKLVAKQVICISYLFIDSTRIQHDWSYSCFIRSDSIAGKDEQDNLAPKDNAPNNVQ